jgi:ketosteroid isomerase-like protein
MTHSNLDLVRSIYRDWERGDFSRVDWAHPEISFAVFDPFEYESQGLGAMDSTWQDWLAAWDEYRVELEQLREVSEDCILSLVRASGRTGGSGATVQHQSANIFRVSNGRVIRLALYADRDRAFADLGLTLDDS